MSICGTRWTRGSQLWCSTTIGFKYIEIEEHEVKYSHSTPYGCFMHFNPAFTNEVWSGSGYLPRSSVPTGYLMNIHLIYTLRTTVSFPTSNSPWRLQADMRGESLKTLLWYLWAKHWISVSCNKDKTMLKCTTKVLRSSDKLESKHAVENMLHWLVRIIFSFNWTQIP